MITLKKFFSIKNGKRKSPFRLLRILLYSLAGSGIICVGAAAENLPPSPAITGVPGLVSVPGARFDDPGTIRAVASHLEPYTHLSLGFQLAEPLFVNFRQTMEVPGVTDDPKRLYPGLDLKIRLAGEGAFRPAIALGLQSAAGHRRMSAEYLALSRRYLDFDFTGGVAWGRMGSAGHIKNPLGVFGGHFNKARALDGEDPAGPQDWFTGRQAGLFGGIEYFTPLEGLSVKAEIGADRYSAERAAFDYDSPAPWSAGVNYRPADWVDISGGVAGGDKVFGRISLQCPVRKWPGRGGKETNPAPFRPYRTGLTLPEEMRLSAQKSGIELTSFARSPHHVFAEMHVSEDHPLPLQAGRAARHMANHGGKSVEKLTIAPHLYGLRGPSISIMRTDLERALSGRSGGSPQEIWQNARFGEKFSGDMREKGGKDEKFFSDFSFRLALANEISLAEEDSGVLYRSAVLASLRRRIGSGFISGEEWRVNFKDNLHRLREFRSPGFLPVRGDVDAFTARTLSADRAYLSWLTTIRDGFYGAITSGYLEEMYGGAGGEILYRPYGKTYALGVELWQAFKRDPYAPLNLGYSGDHVLSGHVNAWYEVPETGITLQAKIGRYLAEDWGATLSVNHEFGNGADLSAFVTITDRSDYDLFGSTTHLYHGLRLSLPLGNFRALPEGTGIITTAAPIGRDNGQSIDKPVDLFELTRPFSKRHVAQNWNGILD